MHSLHAIGLRLYKIHCGEPKLATRETVRELLRAASTQGKSHKFPERFLVAEWEQVVDAWQVESGVWGATEQ